MMRMFVQTIEPSSSHLTQDVIRLCLFVAAWISVTNCFPSNAGVLVKCMRLASLPPGTTTVPFLAGESVRFLCETLSGEIVRETVKWSVNGRELDASECPLDSSLDCARMVLFGDQLLLRNLSSADTGNIRCYTNHSISAPLNISVEDTNSNAPFIWKPWNQTAVVGANVTIVFLSRNADFFLFWRNGPDDLIPTGIGSRYDNTMNGYLTISHVVEEDEGWITMQARNVRTQQKETTASLYLKVVSDLSTSLISTPTAIQDKATTTRNREKRMTSRPPRPTTESLISTVLSAGTGRSLMTPTVHTRKNSHNVRYYIGGGVGFGILVVVCIVAAVVKIKKTNSPPSSDVPGHLEMKNCLTNVQKGMEKNRELIINVQKGVEQNADMNKEILSQTKENRDVAFENALASEDNNVASFPHIASKPAANHF